MKEIKFRVFDKNKKKMIYSKECGMSISQYEQLKIFFSIISKNPNNFSEPMLFINLKDKNGKEIYGGDYLQTRIALNRREIFKVQWKANRFIWLRLNDGFYGQVEEGKDYEWQEIEWNFGKSIEVFGNIYENPELLK